MVKLNQNPELRAARIKGNKEWIIKYIKVKQQSDIQSLVA